MTNDSVDPKVLCFSQDIIVNSAFAITSYFHANSCEEIRKIECMFPTNVQPNDPEAGDWVTNHVANQTIDHMSKLMSLLKLHLAH